MNHELLDRENNTNLNPKTDADGIIRPYGWFINIDLPQQTITLILLARRERFFPVLTEGFHKKLFNAEVNHTLSHVQIKYSTK